MADPRGQLVHEPMRWVRIIRPRWVALEQVPEVLGYWRWISRELAEMGYSTWCGILNAADYGVPQVRKRAILLASLDRAVQPPAPTHSKTGHAEMFGDGRLPWVTMAEGLGWGLTDRPAYTVCAGSADGGADLAGSGDTRRQLYRAVAEGRWKLVTPGRSYDAPPRRADPTTEPAPTIALGNNASAWCWERPATTICASNPGIVNPKGGGANVPTSRRGYIPVGDWPFERPATTVQCDERVSQPGDHGESGQMKDAVRVTIAELGVLQGFPPDHPWQAPHAAKQVGNAIPPPLAEACLRAIAG